MIERNLNHAVVRPPGASFAGAISTSHASIDVALAQAQHAEYCQALRVAGIEVKTLPADERFPDSCFMQDPALVIARQAIIGRMSAASRSGEEEPICGYLAGKFPVQRIEAPGILEGGDVMLLPDRVLVGHSGRTNLAGIEQLAEKLAGYGLPVVSVPVIGYLHLLTAATYIGHNTLLAVDAYAGHPAFAGLDILVVEAREAYAANALGIGESVVLPAGHPRVAAALRSRGFVPIPVPLSEYEKADGGVTCLSLVWDG
jgi:dimethylargininase